MFSKLALVFAAAAFVVPALAQDATAPATIFNPQTNKCNVGSLECCKSVQKAESQAAQQEAGFLNIAAGAVQALIGVNCTPISALIGVGAGSNCNATPACCKKNNNNGIVTLGCVPVNANL